EEQVAHQIGRDPLESANAEGEVEPGGLEEAGREVSPGLARPNTLAWVRLGGGARGRRRRGRFIEPGGEGRLRSARSLAVQGRGESGDGRLPVEVDHREAREVRILSKLGDGSCGEQRVAPETEA